METYTFLFPTAPGVEVRLASSLKVGSRQIQEVKQQLLTVHWPPNLSIRPAQVASLRFFSMGKELTDQDTLQTVKRTQGDNKPSPIQVHIVRGAETRVRTDSPSDIPPGGNCCCACIVF